MSVKLKNSIKFVVTIIISFCFVFCFYFPVFADSGDDISPDSVSFSDLMSEYGISYADVESTSRLKTAVALASVSNASLADIYNLLDTGYASTIGNCAWITSSLLSRHFSTDEVYIDKLLSSLLSSVQNLNLSYNGVNDFAVVGEYIGWSDSPTGTFSDSRYVFTGEKTLYFRYRLAGNQSGVYIFPIPAKSAGIDNYYNNIDSFKLYYNDKVFDYHYPDYVEPYYYGSICRFFDFIPWTTNENGFYTFEVKFSGSYDSVVYPSTLSDNYTFVTFYPSNSRYYMDLMQAYSVKQTLVEFSQFSDIVSPLISAINSKLDNLPSESPEYQSAKQASKEVIDDTLDNFTGSGKGAAKKSDTSSMAGVSSSISSGLNAGGSVEGATSVFSDSSSLWEWFSQSNYDNINGVPSPTRNSLLKVAPSVPVVPDVPDFYTLNQQELKSMLGGD